MAGDHHPFTIEKDLYSEREDEVDLGVLGVLPFVLGVDCSKDGGIATGSSLSLSPAWSISPAAAASVMWSGVVGIVSVSR